MLESVRRLFDRHLRPPAESQSPDESDRSAPSPALAACALMLELAYADEEFSERERQHIRGVLGRHFGLPPEQISELIEAAEAERRQSVDLYQFTSLIVAEYDEAQRMVLAEALWGLVLSDGEIAKHEQYLMRKLSTLLELRPGYLAEARRRAQGEA